MTDLLPILVSGLVLGLAGSVHCVAMCGGIAGAVSQAASAGQGGAVAAARAALLASAGRIASYAMAGALAGAFGGTLTRLVAVGGAHGTALRTVLALVIVAVGFELARTGRAFGFLERAGAALWRHATPLLRRIGRPERAWQVLAMGAIWGWLPCGLVYAGLVVAAAAGRPDQGALAMLSFGLGTLPAVVGASGFSTLLARAGGGASARRRAGLALLAFGLWSLAGTWLFAGGSQHACH